MDDRGFEEDPTVGVPNPVEFFPANMVPHPDMNGGCHANEEGDDDAFMHNAATLPKGTKPSDMRMSLPVDEDDYLMPSPRSKGLSTTYMDLIGDSRYSNGVDGLDPRLQGYGGFMPDFVPPNGQAPLQGVDNIEYHLMNNRNGPAHPLAMQMPRDPGPQYVNTCPLGSPNTVVPPQQPGVVTRKQHSSDEDTDDHEYYNDYDRLKRELQPLNHRSRSETTV
ncbi:hypothetical protein HPB51_010206 [Rhipicephalus microplus]|uniref:Uncharacterized protein n=2 Tax=Rhipicephalus TaxID=34630 RepID=A0A9J6F146_RHIMP|nr:hypothetical protein HPB51_010206 [Rhipicephalus microplus]